MPGDAGQKQWKSVGQAALFLMLLHGDFMLVLRHVKREKGIQLEEQENMLGVFN